ncbi:MAG: Elongation factor Ts [Parcubacteria group bacterium GW2011_GWF2_38_76]|nr:MAG: Elongation factor Ts [Parcubacteria group bacterium GW2011_GWF2_38_76]HBM45503.1 elongation factor Ts [Patescibacteria group bacterium]
MAITTEQIKKLRDLTGGISIMQCRKALEEAGGDEAKALLLLSKKGAEVAAKKSERTLGAGVVQSYVHSNGTVGALIELNSESDFVAKNEAFKALAYDIAMHIVALKPEYLKEEDVPAETLEKIGKMFSEEVEKSNKPEEIKKKMLEGKIASYVGERTLLKQPFIKNPDQTIEDLIKTYIQKFGEKIEIARFARFSVLDK